LNRGIKVLPQHNEPERIRRLGPMSDPVHAAIQAAERAAAADPIYSVI